MTRAVEVIAASVAGCVAALTVVVPQLVDAHADARRADAEKRIIETRCTVWESGAATCAPGTFEVGK